MTDRQYFNAVWRITESERQSLMASEAERRRTFAAHWPIESAIKANDCARSGFYYLGQGDRVQCAFCGGGTKHWRRGDVPSIRHRDFFSDCNMAHGKYIAIRLYNSMLRVFFNNFFN